MIDITGLRQDKRPQSSTIVHALLDRLEAAEKERDELQAALQRIADGQEMSGVFTFADVVLRYQEIARAAIARPARREAVTQFVEQLRNQAKWYAQPGHNARDLMDSRLLEKAADEIEHLAAKLEAAGKERGIDEQRIADLMEELNRVGHENDALRAKIEQMEKQEPVGTLHDDGCFVWRETAPHQSNYAGWKMALYALPGAQAQPAQSVPNGWLRAIDEALVVAHIGVANPSDTYEQARAKLDSLIGFHTDVATDPAVNGGWKLVPIEPTTNMLCEMERQWMLGSQIDMAKREWKAALAAAPEAKT